MALFDRHEQTFTRGTDLALSEQLHGDRGAVFKQVDHLGVDREFAVNGGWTTQFDLVRGGDGARGFAETLLGHDGHGCGPIAVAVHQRSNDAAVHHPWEGLVVQLRLEAHGQPTVGCKIGVDLQASLVGRATTETN